MLQAQIFVDKDDMHGNVPLHVFIMHFLIKQTIAGATSFTGDSGFGKSHHLKHPGSLFSFDEPPILITFIDSESKVKTTLTELRKHMDKGIIITNKVDVWN